VVVVVAVVVAGAVVVVSTVVVVVVSTAVVVEAVVVVVAVVPVVVPPAAAAPHVLDGSTSQTSPLAIRFAAAWTETLIRTHFVALPVRWQRTTFPVEGSVVEAVVVDVAGDAAPLPLPWPLPGGGEAIAIEVARPATKSVRKRAFDFMREILSRLR
jgi:hypothetical protein